MPKGPKGEQRPADVIGNAVKVMRIATGEETEDLPREREEAWTARRLQETRCSKFKLRHYRIFVTIAGPRCNMNRFHASRTSQTCFDAKAHGELSPADAGGWASSGADLGSGHESAGLCRSLPTSGPRGCGR